MNKMRRLKGSIARVIVGAFLLQCSGISLAAPTPIPTGTVDFSVLAAVSAGLGPTSLVKWRRGAANQIPVGVSTMTFAYLGTGTGLALPDRSTVHDNTANNQNDMWSDNAIKISTFTKPNNDSTAIVIYTNNTDSGVSDPLHAVALRGGLVGSTDRASVLPLLWKAVDEGSLVAASSATVTVGGNPIPATSVLYMPTQITGTTGGHCSAEGPYAASDRTNNGFCDYSTHFFMDKNDSDPLHLWYQNSSVVDKAGAYHYASLIGRLGVNTTEQGAGTAQFKPAYFLLGVSAANVETIAYSTTINVEAVNY